jgi:predicted aspartyl protease
MIEGVIRETGTPVVTLKVLGSMREITVEGILDTGFDGFLCLPIPAAITLGLELIDKYLCEIISTCAKLFLYILAPKAMVVVLMFAFPRKRYKFNFG